MLKALEIRRKMEQERDAAAFFDYISRMFCYLEYYLEVSQGNVLLSIMNKTMLDPKAYSIIEDLETGKLLSKNINRIEGLSVDEVTKSRIYKFIGLVEQGDFYQAARLMPSLRASLGIYGMPALKA